MSSLLKDLVFSSDGGNGADGIYGYAGANGSNWRGGHGRRGGDAGPAVCGQHAGQVGVWLSSGLRDPSN